MLTKLVTEGERVELISAQNGFSANADADKVIYQSRVYNVLSDDSMEILMPMEKTKLVLLPVDEEYDMVLYTREHGMFQGLVRVVDRYKSSNMYLLHLELVSNLRKCQRREYYRLSCALEMNSRRLTEEEVTAIRQKEPYIFQTSLPMQKSIIVDISGGGLRFVSDFTYEAGGLIYCTYAMERNTGCKQYEMAGKLLSVREMENKPGFFEHRMQYYDMDIKTREEIIQCIFELERRERRKDSAFAGSKAGGRTDAGKR